ncbi:MAG: hypothetical protein ACP5H2_01685 [Solirubrobacteraceae bacterium]
MQKANTPRQTRVPDWLPAVAATKLALATDALKPCRVSALAPPARTVGQAMVTRATTSGLVLVVPYRGRFLCWPANPLAAATLALTWLRSRLRAVTASTSATAPTTTLGLHHATASTSGVSGHARRNGKVN